MKPIFVNKHEFREIGCTVVFNVLPPETQTHQNGEQKERNGLTYVIRTFSHTLFWFMCFFSIKQSTDWNILWKKLSYKHCPYLRTWCPFRIFKFKFGFFVWFVLVIELITCCCEKFWFQYFITCCYGTMWKVKNFKCWFPHRKLLSLLLYCVRLSYENRRKENASRFSHKRMDVCFHYGLNRTAHSPLNSLSLTICQ